MLICQNAKGVHGHKKLGTPVPAATKVTAILSTNKNEVKLI